nr:toll/interleukin-1 receptor domain-containing protein [uncultured Pseudodesulfovibrio sp.]
MKEIADFLRQNDIDSWVDEAEIRIGESLITKISKGIYETDLILAFLSASSVVSPWVQKELSLAMNREICERRIAVLPILIDACPIPHFLRDKLYADLVTKSSYEKELHRIVSTIFFYRSSEENVSPDSGIGAKHGTTQNFADGGAINQQQSNATIGDSPHNQEVFDRNRKRKNEAIQRLWIFGFICGVIIPMFGLVMPVMALKVAYVFGGGLMALSCFFVGRGLAQTVDAIEDNPNLLAITSEAGNSWVFSKEGWEKFAHFHDYRWGVRKMLVGCLLLALGLLVCACGLVAI